MNTAQTKNQRAKSTGAVICALLLCFGMVPLLASLGTNSAHAEGNATPSEGLAATSATGERTVGYYATGTNSKLDGSGTPGMPASGNYGYNSNGDLVSLPGLDIKGSEAYIAADKIDSFLSSTQLHIYDMPNSSLGPDIVWYALRTIPTVESPKTPDRPSPTLPEAGNDHKDFAINDNTSMADLPKEEATAPTQPTSPSLESTNQATALPNERPLLTLQCRESEAQEKTAELESQGFEIVRIEKLPKWYH